MNQYLALSLVSWSLCILVASLGKPNKAKDKAEYKTKDTVEDRRGAKKSKVRAKGKAEESKVRAKCRAEDRAKVGAEDKAKDRAEGRAEETTISVCYKKCVVVLATKGGLLVAPLL